MAYSKNNPSGLTPVGHITGNVYNPFTSCNKYTLDPTTTSLAKGDAVMISPRGVNYPINMYYPGDKPMVTLYYPIVTINAAGIAATISLTNCSIPSTPMHGVFQSCSYFIGAQYFEREYWTAGTVATSEVIATIIDDGGVIYTTTLGTYTGSMLTNNADSGTRFNTMPAIQREIVGAWPTTSAAYANTNPTIGNSCVIGSNLAFLTGDYLTNADQGATKVGSLSTIMVNGILGGDGTPYRDNPKIVDRGTALGNPLNVSTFYACPAIQITSAIPAIVDGRCEPVITRVLGPLKLLGFVEDEQNLPYPYGVGKFNGINAGVLNPPIPTLGNYENTPFLKVRVIINNHTFKAATISTMIE